MTDLELSPELTDLGLAVGLLSDRDGDVGLDSDFFDDPIGALSAALSVDDRRDALFRFVETVLGAGEHIERDGVTLLPIISAAELTDDPVADVRLLLTVDDRPAEYVDVGIAASFHSAGGECSVEATVPFYRTGKLIGDTIRRPPIRFPILDGEPIKAGFDLVLGDGSPDASGFALRQLSFAVCFPPSEPENTTVELRLLGLRLPGSTDSVDLLVGGADADLDDILLSLLLGVVRAAVTSLGSAAGDAQAALDLLGLGDDPTLPPLDVNDLMADGVETVRRWFADTLTDAAARSAWLDRLGVLLDGTRDGEVLRVPLGAGPAQLSLSLAVIAGADGHPRITPRVGLGLIAAGPPAVRAEATCDLFTINSFDGSIRALPGIEVDVAFGGTPPLVASGDITVGTARFGISVVDGGVQPLIRLLDCEVRGAPHPVLDLSSADAVAAAAGEVAGDLLGTALDALGPAAVHLRALLGLDPPAGVPALDVGRLLGDPLGALADWWWTLIDQHSSEVPTVLGHVRDLVADELESALAIQGSGGATDPWRVRLAPRLSLDAWRDGDAVIVAPRLTFRSDTLGDRCTVVEGAATVPLARLDFGEGRVSFLDDDVSLTVEARGRGLTEARLGLGPVPLIADHIGAAVRWSPRRGLRFDVESPNLRTETADGTPVPLELPQSGPAAGLSAESWAAIERLVAVMADAASFSVVGDLTRLVGWTIDGLDGPVDGADAGDLHLPLADLATDPGAALEAWARALLSTESGLVLVANLVARLLTGNSDGVRGAIAGLGSDRDPLRLPLGLDRLAPALTLSLGPDGPIRTPVAADIIESWRPGQPGFDPATLAGAIRAEGEVNPAIAELARGRDHLEVGLAALAARLGGTDGLVAPPPIGSAGVDILRHPAMAWDGWAELDPTEAFGAALPADAAVVHVAFTDPDPASWPGADPSRLLDLTPAGLPVESFTVDRPDAGTWYVALGPGAGSVVEGESPAVVGDRQVERLIRILGALSAGGREIWLLARGGAGHAARSAADRVAAVTRLTTLGTPWSTVGFDTARNGPPADIVRLLDSLLPAVDPTDPDDDDLALGRSLVAGMLAASGRAGAARIAELAVEPPDVAPRTGLAVRAWFGVLPAERVRSALTAVAAAGLWRRVVDDVPRAVAEATGADLSLTMPITAGVGVDGITVTGSVTIGLIGGDLDATATAPFSRRPTVTLRLRVADDDGWLVGGPGTGAIGGAPPVDLRHVDVQITVGLGPDTGDVTRSAELILHEGSAFGVNWDTMPVRPNLTVTGELDENPLLPEARVCLAGLVTRLEAEAAGSAGRLVADLFRAAGIATAELGFIPDALAHLLHDPGGFVAGLVAVPARRDELASAIADLAPGVTVAGSAIRYEHPAATIGFDLATGRAAVSASSVTSGMPWRFQVDGIGGPRPTVSASVGREHPNAVAVDVTGFPLRVDLRRVSSAGGEDRVPLWPAPSAEELWDLGRSLILAEALRLVLDSLRRLDAEVSEVLEALADGVGLLADATVGLPRPLDTPLGLVIEPAAWLDRHLAAGGPVQARAERLFESLKPFLGMEGSPPGEWRLTDGVVVTLASGTVGPRLGLALDPTAWLDTAGRDPFVAGVDLGLTVAGDRPPQVAVDLFAGVTADAGPSTVRVGLNSGGISVILRRPGRPDLALYPHPAGLGSLLSAGVEALLPQVLDAIAALESGTAGDIGDFVGALGRGLGVATGGTIAGSSATFSATELRNLAADPGGVLAARIPTLIAEVAAELDTVLGPLPGTTRATVDPTGRLTLTVRGLTVTFDPTPLSITVTGISPPIDIVGPAATTLTVDGGGPSAWALDIGPGALPIGGPTLRPALSIAGDPAAGWRVDVGLALDDGAATDVGHRELIARWSEADGLNLLVTRVDAAEVVELFDDGTLAAAMVAVVADLLGTWVLSVPEIAALLDRPAGTPATTARQVLRSSLLTDDGTALRTGFLGDPVDTLLTLIRRLADALPPLRLDPFTVGIGLTPGDVVALELGLAGGSAGGGLALTGDSVALSLVADSEWIEPPDGAGPPPGLQIGVLRIVDSTFELAPDVAVNGVGLRISGSDGPLVDSGVRLVAIEVNAFGRVAMSGGTVATSGGVRFELEGLAVPLGASGGDNQVAQGIMADAGDSGKPPAPGLSPALAVQSHAGQDGPTVSFRAGSGDGPWYLPIQQAFGPVYLEQVGLGVGYFADDPRQLEWISLSLDGSVSLLGLTAAVDKLRLTYSVTEPIFKASSWKVDVDGFAVASDVGGLVLVGGLRKVPLEPPDLGIEYLGMLKIEFSGYGLSLFGGYAAPTSAGGSYASFFAFGALLAPLGGPPAFFITGIGLGFGINRELETPTVENLPTNPFLNALRIGGEAPDPMAQLESLRSNIRPARGQHWLAAGISFTSFVLVTGEVVIVVEFGDGLDVALLGLARVQLPGPPPAALVSIELALLARFSTKEGVLLVQAQLTENSWLLDPAVRLTGGFAFATWWKGPTAGQFVVSIGGYHPRFHNPAYPVVPRVGINWSPSSNVTVKGEGYFALCSEALMAGLSVEASARFGPAYARLSFGGDGIIFFDPFWFSVSAHAEVAAGIRINVFFGTITVELSLGVWVEVSGPPVYVEGRFKICGFTVPFEIGDSGSGDDRGLDAAEFEAKYLRADDGAQPIQASVVKGRVLPGRNATGRDDRVPDGSRQLPFLLTPEFELLLVTTVPMTAFELIRPELTELDDDPDVDAAEQRRRVGTPASGLALAPMKAGLGESTLAVEVHKTDTRDIEYSIDDIEIGRRPKASFPKGVWGPAQNRESPTVPEGKVVNAEDRISLSTVLPESRFQGAPPIDYHQVELPRAGRKPLPFVTDRDAVNARRAEALELKDIADGIRPPVEATDRRYLVAASLLSIGGSQPTTVAAIRGERTAVPVIASLADDLSAAPDPVSTAVEGVVIVPVDRPESFVPPHIRAILSTSNSISFDGGGRATTVSNAPTVARRPAPTMAGVSARLARTSPVELVVRRVGGSSRGSIRARRDGVTVLANAVPVSRLASMPTGAVANAAAGVARTARLQEAGERLTGGGVTIPEGELVVVGLGGGPEDGTDTVTVAGGPTRLISLAAGGRILDDVKVVAGETVLPADADRLIIVPLGEGGAVGGTVTGWYAGQSLPTVGWDLAVAGGAVVRFGDAKPPRTVERQDGGWANTRDLILASRIVTRFDEAVTAVAVAVDDGDGDSIDALRISLAGATRDPDRPSRLLTAGTRSMLVFAVVPDGDADVAVVIDGSRDVRIAGVVGLEGDTENLAQRLRGGLETVVRPPLTFGGGRRTVAWHTTREQR